MIARCENAGAVSNSSEDASSTYVTTHAGGIIGYVGGPYDRSIVISDCVNRGEVSSGYEPADSEIIRKCAGGIVAKVESLNKQAVFLVENTANCGRISGHSAAGLISRIGANANYAYTAVVISNVANYAAVEGAVVVAQAIGKITVPNVKYDRRIANAFFETSSNSGVALFGDESTAEAFAVENVIDSNAKGVGYSATDDRDALNAFAASNNLEPWTLSRLADKTVVPMLSRFCEKEYFPGFVIRVK